MCSFTGCKREKADKFDAKSEIDYSDFGFQNNDGMLEWIQIYDYDFSDKENAYICVNSWHYVVSYENGYYEERYFSRFKKTDNDPLF